MAAPVKTDRQMTEELLENYGGEVDDYFKIWPPDKKYYFSKNKKAFLAYAVKFGVAVCLFDPIGPYQSISQLLDRFKKYCIENDLDMIFIQNTNKYDKLYRKIGLRRMLIGADAVIDINQFSDETVHNKYFRNIVNRFSKQGFTVNTHNPPHSDKLISEIQDISTDWLKLPHHKEWNFLTGRFDKEYLNTVPLYILKDKDKKAWAFINGLPTYRKDTASMDLIRRRRDAPPNSIDYLLIGIMKSMSHHNGTKYFNIGMSPIDGSYFAKLRSEQILNIFYKSSQRFIGFRGLHQFKSKYKPEWEPRYVYFNGGLSGLVKMGIAIYRLMT